MIKICYVSEEMEDELKAWYDIFNKIAKEKTNYEIRQGNPTASKICASILSIVRQNLDNFNFDLKDDDRYSKVLNMNGTFTCNVNINVSLNKIKGIKKNEISFL